VNVKHSLLSSLQSSSALSLFSSIKGLSFKGSNSNSLLSGIKLFAFFISWVILEDSVGTKDDCLNKGSKSWVLGVISDFKFVISLVLTLLLISFEDLVIDRGINNLSIVVHV
jgi:hypothetical protein